MDPKFLEQVKERLLSDQKRLTEEIANTKFEDVGDEEGEKDRKSVV